MNFRNAFHRSGGIGYHLAALVYRKRWRKFRDHVTAHLALALSRASAQKKLKRVVLIGPSLAHCFDPEIFLNVSELHVIDADPVAAKFFRRKTSHPNLVTHNADAFEIRDGKFYFERLEPVQTETLFIFCNVLGQIPTSLAFQNNLNRISWVSFHDRLSWKNAAVSTEELLGQGFQSDERILQIFFKGSKKNPTEVYSHETEDLGKKGSNHAYYEWQINRRQTHVIEVCECIRVAPAL